MNEKDITKHERRGYSRGYQAGLRRRQHEVEQLTRELERSIDARRERIFCAVINGLLASGNTSNWQVGDERIHNSKTYTRLAKMFVDEAMRQLRL